MAAGMPCEAGGTGLVSTPGRGLHPSGAAERQGAAGSRQSLGFEAEPGLWGKREFS